MEVSESILNATSEDVAQVRAAGFAVQDENDPAPENIPNAADQCNSGVTYSKWGGNAWTTERQTIPIRIMRRNYLSCRISSD